MEKKVSDWVGIFFIAFITLPIDIQLNGLFSDCQNILTEVQDVIDCLKLFVMSLYEIHQSI